VRGCARASTEESLENPMTFSSTRDPVRGRLLRLTAVLFISYLCVGLSLPVVPVQVTGRLGLGNAWAGLAVGVAFLATILSRGHAGGLSDRRGPKLAVMRGLAFYGAAAVTTWLAGLMPPDASSLAYATLLAGRLLLGLGESLVGVGVVAWGIGLVGPARSGQVLALVGAAIYGALAVGGPLGLMLLERLGFAGTMAVSAVLPCLSLIAAWRMDGVAAHPGTQRASLWRVVRMIRWHGAIVGLQGIGFAAIGAFFALHFMARNWTHAGLGLTAFGTGFVLVRVLGSRLPDRVGGLPVAIGSLAIEAVGQVLIWRAGHPGLALAGAFMTGLGCSMIFPAMGREVVRLVEPHLRGTALGGFSAFQDLAYGLTGPLAGLLADHAGHEKVFLVGAGAAAAGLAIAILLHAKAPSRHTQATATS
jgi:MFS family permease